MMYKVFRYDYDIFNDVDIDMESTRITLDCVSILLHFLLQAKHHCSVS